MTEDEQGLTTAMNKAIVAEAMQYVQLWRLALVVAAREGNTAKLKELAATAEKHAANLSDYIDNCSEALDPFTPSISQVINSSVASVRWGHRTV